MRLTKSVSDSLQLSFSYINDSTSKQSLRNMSNRIRQRFGNHAIRGTHQEPRQKRSKKTNFNRSINREEQVEKSTTSPASESTSSENRVTMSYSDALKSNVLYTDDSNPKVFSEPDESGKCSNQKRRRQKIPSSIHEGSGSTNAASVHDPELSTPGSFDVPKYDSDVDYEPKIQRIAKSKKTWIESKVFANASEAKAFMQQESTWSINTTNKLSNGKKVIYRCTNAKLRGKQCDASVYLLYLSKKEEVIMYTTAEQHSCQPNQNKKMTEETKAIIEQLFMDGFKTRKAIQCKLAAANIELPTKNQLHNFISELNVKIFGRTKISIGELEAFLQRHSTVPEDPDEAFIVDYLCDDTNDADFNWINGSCSCPSFMKTYICKHMVGLAIRLKYIKPPIEAKALPLNQKRKRGRPSKARKALITQ